MLKLDVTGPEYVSLKHEGDKVLVFEKGDLLFIFNFNSSQSFVDYKIGVEHPGKYKVVLDSDAKEFGGHQRLDDLQVYFTSDEPWNHRKNSMQVYIPTRTALVLQLAKD